ncbi:uncharacterized protein LOC107422523 isoform X2 [Ziziphus jujuba]|uniref:Uncharacterized protein LOC107422523 isoform X2 n=1 Tax=Ziziphus jujuba TaxID=326968 RepID=A0ABM3IRD0_ZIZJJ|nr:uncharacterized protein LOC107422523 isoform X2 [Ziziphus jujuba]
METKQTPFREIGQRSIVSSLLSRSSNPFKVLKEDAKNEGSEKKSPVSFSDFLQRKLHQTSEPPRTVKVQNKKLGTMMKKLRPRKEGKGTPLLSLIKGFWNSSSTLSQRKNIVQIQAAAAKQKVVTFPICKNRERGRIPKVRMRNTSPQSMLHFLEVIQKPSNKEGSGIPIAKRNHHLFIIIMKTDEAGGTPTWKV